MRVCFYRSECVHVCKRMYLYSVPALGVGQHVRGPRAQARRGPKSRYVMYSLRIGKGSRFKFVFKLNI
jgi:hypothetical protein